MVRHDGLVSGGGDASLGPSNAAAKHSAREAQVLPVADGRLAEARVKVKSWRST
jgi:hypothetical protein